MAIEVQLPDIGADAAEVTEILVTVGDSVELDAPLLVVEGEKAAMEIPSPQAGTVAGIQVSVGDEVTSGTVIVTLEREAAATAPAPEGSRWSRASATRSAHPSFRSLPTRTRAAARGGKR